MAVNQTKCPFCGCMFFITSLQLGAHRGQVRCGQCHHVFDASANIAEPTATTSSTEPQQNSNNLHVAAPKNTTLDTPNTLSPSATPTPNITPQLVSNDEEPTLFSDEQGINSSDDDEPESTDNDSGNTSGLTHYFDSSFLDQQLNQPNNMHSPLQPHEHVEKLNKGADDTWIEQLLNEQNKHTEVPLDNENDPSSVLLPTLTQNPPVMSEHDEDLLSYLNRTGVTSLAHQSNEDVLYTADQKPAQHRILKPTAAAVEPSYMIGWSAMCLMMIGLLLTQYIYFNFEKLSFNPTTAVYMQRVCVIAQCELPYMNEKELHLKNIRLRRSSNNQTTFSARLVNSAPRSQPFPALTLTLKRNGDIVGKKVIQPRQYLPDNLKTFSRITTRTPYPVQFTIKYPRSDIRAYDLVAGYH